jgi:hypothetical protein
MTSEQRTFAKERLRALIDALVEFGTDRRELAILVGQVADMVREDCDRAQIAARRKAGR